MLVFYSKIDIFKVDVEANKVALISLDVNLLILRTVRCVLIAAGWPTLADE